MDALALPVLLAVGGLLALQAGANVRLSTAMRSPFGAATLQLGLAAGLLLALALAVGTLTALATVPDVEPWHLVGGPASAVYITAGILLFPRLGAVATVGLFIAGQMIASLALDGAGLLGVAQDRPGSTDVVGLAALAAGTVLIVRAQAGGQVRRGGSAWMVLGLVGGAVLPVQGAINAQLRQDLDAPVTVGALSFVVATAAMAAALLAALAFEGAPRPRVAPLRDVPWWGWLGGLCGAIYVVSVFLLIPEIGAASVVALTVGGQQLASLFVDRYGLMLLPRRPVTRQRVAGVAALMVGVGLLQLA
jgi:transporter family-2 protein